MNVFVVVGIIAIAQAGQPDVRCGAFCTYVCLRALGIPVGRYDEFEQRLGPPTAAGYSLGQLSDVARMYGAETLGVTTSLANLDDRPGRFTCIVRLPPAHFVVLSEVAAGRAMIVDSPDDYSVPASTLEARWDGAALLISDEPLVPEEEIGASHRGMAFWISLCIFSASLIIGAMLWFRKSPSFFVSVAWSVILAFIAGCERRPADGDGAPRISFEKSICDLGEISVDKTQPYSVKIDCGNHGAGDLLIAQLVASCGCVGARISRDVIPPGETGVITLEISRRTPEPRTATLTVHSNDPNSPRREIRLSWRAVGVLELEPPSLDLGTITAGQVARGDVTFFCRDGQGADQFDSPLSKLPAELRVLWKACGTDTDPSPQRRILSIEVEATGQPGEAFISVPIVRCGHDAPEIALPVRWRVSEVIDVSPRSLMFRPGRAGERRSHRLIVSTAAGAKLAIDKVEVGKNQIGCRSSLRVIAQSVIAIDLESTLPDSAGCHRFLVHVRCCEPLTQRISIPVVAYVVDDRPAMNR